MTYLVILSDIDIRRFRPIGYAIPADGPVGDLLNTLNRPVFRPAHLHIMINVSLYTSRMEHGH
jgi:hydroxyquinol 1,2-dioxygenase